ncbi:MAG: DUF669 domain-containing protein [Planctomycetota bacterium]
MANLTGFNAHEVEPTTPFEPIPAGRYLAAVTASEMKPVKSGSGSYLELTFTVLEGEYKNRVLWARLNLNNPNPTAVKIARSELSALCRAVGVMQPKDSVELHNIPLLITVKVKKRSDNDELTNEIKKFEPKSAVAGQPQQARQADSTPPWKR